MKLITWNIQWGRGADGRVDLDRIVRHARRAADFDVLCLQEVAAGYDELPGHDGCDEFAELEARLSGYRAVRAVATDAPHPSGARRCFGNLLFSRLPVAGVYRHLLPWPCDPAVPSMQRVALEATVLTPMGPLRITTTHLEYYSARQRAAQVRRLRELHAEATAQVRAGRPGVAADGPFDVVPRGAACVLAGDFNFTPDAPDRLHLLSPIDADTPPYRDAWEVAHPGAPHAPTVGLHDLQQALGPPSTWDYVFVSADIAPRIRSVRVDAHTDASDHQPVIIELDVAPV